MSNEEPDMLDLIELVVRRPGWLGVATDSRRLFDALQDGWLRPLPSRTGSIVGVNAHVREIEADGNRIPVRVQLEVARLPDLKVIAFRNDQWRFMPLSQVAATDAAVFWPGVLPVFSAGKLTVSSDEQRVRLLSIGKRIANIEVPDVSVERSNTEDTAPQVIPPDLDAGLVVPESEDPLRGAMSMALWSVPRIDPWMDVLTASLCPHAEELRKVADAVEASWWRFPPWVLSHDSKPTDAQERLWLAALTVFRSLECERPREAADRIAAAALGDCPTNDSDVVEAWHLATQRVLRAEIAIELGDWRKGPVGLAIQLVLSRPEPIAFKTWFDDNSVRLPPAVAWSAATLCGLWHGYKRLDTRFRGKPVQREVLAIQNLRMCSGRSAVRWPGVSNEPPRWRKENGNFILSWGDREIACKREQERGKWYAADLGIDDVHRKALVITKDNGWRCLSRVLTLKGGSRSISSLGGVEFGEQKIKVNGDVRIRLSPGDVIEEVIDEDAFRRLVAIEPGRLPAPPSVQVSVELREEEPGIPGLTIVRDFLAEGEERRILEQINKSEWSNELKRRVQHYGWRYDYKSKQVDSSMRIGSLPDWADVVAQRLVDEGCVQDVPDQVIVNEYIEDQSIAPHIDSPSSFGSRVAMISLLETWEMEFRKRGSKDKVIVKLDRCSAAILSGEARYDWKHSIPKRKNEPGPVKPGNKKPSRIPRRRRVSLTFRKVIGKANCPSAREVQ